MSNKNDTSNEVSSTHEVYAIHSVQAINLPEFESLPAPLSGKPLLKEFNPIHAVKTKLQVRLVELELTVGELMNAKEHQVFEMNCDIDHPVDLMLEGHVVARGQLVAVDGHFAIKISEIPKSLKAI